MLDQMVRSDWMPAGALAAFAFARVLVAAFAHARPRSRSRSRARSLSNSLAPAVGIAIVRFLRRVAVGSVSQSPSYFRFPWSFFFRGVGIVVVVVVVVGVVFVGALFPWTRASGRAMFLRLVPVVVHAKLAPSALLKLCVLVRLGPVMGTVGRARGSLRRSLAPWLGDALPMLRVSPACVGRSCS